ncbi:MAG: PadR family transcriptional regulator [Gammaproteobacteria bacterium]|nr:PadR family transcriptional regulator [Gammaproteobacteria bacterium]
MDVKTVCLGMLTDGPASGYDMKKCFESSFGHFFPAGYGSIYPALATLARNGLVEFEEVAQEGKPDRKVYSITDKGREELMRGLSIPDPSHKIRSEFLATLWFAHLMSDEQIDTIIDGRLEEINKFLAVIDQFPDCSCDSVPKGARFVAGFGKHMASEFRRYIEQNRDMLLEGDEQQEVLAAVSQ